MKIDSVSASASSVIKNATIGSMDLSVKKAELSNLTEQQQEEQLNVSVQNQDTEKKELTREEVDQIVTGMNEFLKPKMTSLSFKVHDELDRYYVEVIDKETQKVIREIPNKELLDMYAKMTEFLGLFIDKQL